MGPRLPRRCIGRSLVRPQENPGAFEFIRYDKASNESGPICREPACRTLALQEYARQLQSLVCTRYEGGVPRGDVEPQVVWIPWVCPADTCAGVVPDDRACVPGRLTIRFLVAYLFRAHFLFATLHLPESAKRVSFRGHARSLDHHFHCL